MIPERPTKQPTHPLEGQAPALTGLRENKGQARTLTLQKADQATTHPLEGQAPALTGLRENKSHARTLTFQKAGQATTHSLEGQPPALTGLRENKGQARTLTLQKAGQATMHPLEGQPPGLTVLEGKQRSGQESDPPGSSRPGEDADPTPVRHRLAHPTPIDADNRSVIVFVTVCTKNRRPVLANAKVHRCLLDAWNEANHWLVGRYVVMPNHIHLFCSPGVPLPASPSRWAGYWKNLAARNWKAMCQPQPPGGSGSRPDRLEKQRSGQESDPPESHNL